MMKTAAERRRIVAICNQFEGAPDELVFFSFRYFIGRMTFATCTFAQDLAKAWEFLNERTRTQIERELEDAFKRDDCLRAEPNRGSSNYYPLGMDCDRAAWELVRAKYKGV
jgi:hypothetical protein